MLTLGVGTARTCAGPTRRDFLRVGGLGALGLTLADLERLEAHQPSRDRAIILLLLVGGPSQHETWDPKPDAPAEIRGPFGSIATTIPGVRINEHLPRFAQRMRQVALIRSLHHDAAPIHETGQQLVQTGRLSRFGLDHPHVGAVAARTLGSKNLLPPFITVPGPIGNTGVSISHGQSAGILGEQFDPFHVAADPASPSFDPRAVFDRALRFLDSSDLLQHAASSIAERLLERRTRGAFDLTEEPTATRDRYGPTTFGQSCLLARRLVESGARLVTVNMFDTVFHTVSWDCHGTSPFSTLEDYSRVLLPTFDQAYSALLDDLDNRGLLDSTLVVATGEFGRTPRLNAAGGRDHWPGVWSAALAGGGVRGGQTIGASDAQGGAPAERAVAPGELVATMYHSLGIDPRLSLELESGEAICLVDGAGPIFESFA
jgi:uncharacterized protein (DUF1501 family)